MKRENALRQKRHSLDALSEAVSAMKSLSAHHFRLSRAALPAARAYRDAIDEAMATIGVRQLKSTGSGSAILLIAADLGLCDGYNSRLSALALEQQQQLPAKRIYCVGHRPLGAFQRADCRVDRVYHSPTSVAGLTDLLLQLSEDLLVDYLQGQFAELIVVSARFVGVGEFTPVCTKLLPIDPPPVKRRLELSPYVGHDHIRAVAVREYLYIRLFQSALDSLATESSARLVATESAGDWLADKTATTVRHIASLRREAATQEVLDIAAGAKRRRRPRPR